jgi:DegV family protein with EDD domain
MEGARGWKRGKEGVMAKIKIVTDSVADMPHDLVSELDIEMLPVNIVLNGKTNRDKVDIHSETFYANIDNYGKMYSQEISYTDYAYIYKELTRQHSHLVIIHCSRSVSGTYENAVAVHRDFAATHTSKVALFDSGQAGLGLGLLVLDAAKAVQAGYNFEEVSHLVKKRLEKVSTFFYVPSLKYLRKGRKISGLKSALASAMRIQPVLTIREGEIVISSSLTGTRSDISQRFLECIQEDLRDREIINLGIAHAEAPEMAREMKELMLANFACNNVYESYVGPAIGLNTGPGAVGIMYTRK